jgi:hypothetical protein
MGSKKGSKPSPYSGNPGVMRENNIDMNQMGQNPQNYYQMYMPQIPPQMMYYNQQQGMPQSTYFFIN